MGRATISDIARGAGVSTATVDRALNGRAGVSAANRQRVLAAAARLGYPPSSGMVPLPSRPAVLEFFLPSGRSDFLDALGQAIARVAAAHPLVATCRLHAPPSLSPDALVTTLDEVSERAAGIGVVAVDHPAVRAALGRAGEAGLRVVTLASDVPGSGRAGYVGIDNRVAGRTAAQAIDLLTRRRPGTVALLPGLRAFHGHRERAAGFAEVIARDAPHLRVLPDVETGEDRERARHALEGLMRERGDLVGVYCIGGGRAGVAEALRGVGRDRPAAILHELAGGARGWLAEGAVDMVIDLDVEAAAEAAVARLLGAVAATAPLPPLRPIEARLILRENVPPPRAVRDGRTR